ncbi:MAG TPA: hypothetical protein VGU24_20900 [Microvirga sp.]|jgi:hypothetical protein|nr:hypothetical protein [Microvirga sp.]
MDRMARGLRRVLGDDTRRKPTRPKAPPRLPEAAPAAPVYRGPGRAGPLRLSPAVRESLKPRHRGPHKASTIDAVRGLVETTTLSYRAIAARTGVAIGTIARHVRRGGWLRPETGFPEEHYTPEGRRLRRRQALAEHLLACAEAQVDRVSRDPYASPHALKKALQFARAAAALDEDTARRRR